MAKVKELKRKENNNKHLKGASLANKIAIITGGLLTVVFLALIIFTAVSMSSSIKTTTYGQFSQTSKSNGLQVQATLDAASASASSLQDYIVESYKKEATQTADEATLLHKSAVFDVMLSQLSYDAEMFILGTAKSTVNGENDVIGLGTLFEPYAFDSHIRDYSLYLSSEEIANNTIRTVGTYEEYSKGDYYLGASKTMVPYFTSPYEDGGLTVISSCYPIIHKDAVQGVILADLNVGNFDKLFSVDSNYPSMYGSVISENGTIIYDSSDESLINTDFSETLSPQGYEGYLEGIEKKEAFSVVGDEVTRFYYPIAAGQSTWWTQTSVSNQELIAAAKNTTILLIIISIISLFVLILVVSKILKKQLKPISDVVKAADNLANGNLDIHLISDRNDEIGELAVAFDSTSDTLKTIIGDINYLLTEMGNGNFDINTRCEDKYVGEFKNILTSVHIINSNLSNTLSQINETSLQVNVGAEQVSSAAQTLSQGAVEQASSVEELSATISEIASHVKLNANHAQQASAESNDASSGVMESNGQMTAMISAMSDITDKSNEIGKIIKTIEDIAFQTNILALNAAVEAARAGTAGKGFAVVADEVRNLATKSAEAAKNTTSLIEQTVSAVANGSKIADETASSLLSIVDKSEKVNGLIAEIAKASDDQSTSLNQVTVGVDQISSVVQSNSATAEESAAASQQLSAQSEMLRSLVSKFTLKTGGETLNTTFGEVQRAAVTSASRDFETKSENPRERIVPKPTTKPAENPAATPVEKPKPKPTLFEKRAERKEEKRTEKPESRSLTKSSEKATVKPAERTVKPIEKAVAKPIVKTTAKSVERKPAKPIEKKVENKIEEEVFKPIVESPMFGDENEKHISPPITKTAEKPVAKTAANPVAKPAAKPIAKPPAKPAEKATSSTATVKPGAAINDYSDKY